MTSTAAVLLLALLLPTTLLAHGVPPSSNDIVAPKPPRPPHLPWVNRMFYRGLERLVRLAEWTGRKKLDWAGPFPGPAVYAIADTGYGADPPNEDRGVYTAPQKKHYYRRKEH